MTIIGKNIQLCFLLIFLLFVVSCSNKTVSFSQKGDEWIIDDMANGDITTVLIDIINISKNDVNIKLGSGRYTIDETLEIRNRNVSIRGSGVGNTILETHGTFLSSKNDYFHRSTLKNDILPGEQVLYVKSDVPVGCLVCFHSKETYEESLLDYNKTHCNIIQSKSGSSLKLLYPIPLSFKRAVTTISYYESRHLSLSDFTLCSSRSLYAIEARRFSDVHVEGIKISNSSNNAYGAFRNNRSRAGHSGLALYESSNIEVENSKFEYLWYGVLTHDGCTNVSITNSDAYFCRHLNNTGLGTDLLYISDCTAKNCQGGFDSHQTAISSKYVRCQDISPIQASKFRGRVDIIDNCLFENEIEMYYDEDIDNLIGSDGVDLSKSLLNSVVGVGLSSFSGPNITIDSTTFNGAVRSKENSGFLSITNTKFNLGKNNDQLTIGFDSKRPLGYSIRLDNLELNGFNRTNSIGIYFPNQGAHKVEFSNIKITGYDKGIVLYGGKKHSNSYSKMWIDNLLVEDCNYGIYHQDMQKQINVRKMNMRNVKTDINHKSKLKSRKY